MGSTFASIIDEVQRLSFEEKEELRMLLDKYLIEARREEIHDNYLKTKEEDEKGLLHKPKDNKELRQKLEQ